MNPLNGDLDEPDVFFDMRNWFFEHRGRRFPMKDIGHIGMNDIKRRIRPGWAVVEDYDESGEPKTIVWSSEIERKGDEFLAFIGPKIAAAEQRELSDIANIGDSTPTKQTRRL